MHERILPVVLVLGLLVPAGALAESPPPTLGPVPNYRLELASVGAARDAAWLRMPPAALQPPPSGLGALITGWIFVGIGGLNLVTMPICSSDIVDPSMEEGCYAATGIFAGVLIGVGIPLVIIGSKKYKVYKSWRAEHPEHAVLEHLTRTSFQPREGGGVATYRVAF